MGTSYTRRETSGGSGVTGAHVYERAVSLLTSRRTQVYAWEATLLGELGPDKSCRPSEHTLATLAYARRLYSLAERRVAKLREQQRKGET